MDPEDCRAAVIWSHYHELLLKQFLVNLGRAVLLFSSVMLLFALPGAWERLGGTPWPQTGFFVLALLDAVLPLSLLVATLFTVGPRAHFKELAGLTASGYSMIQILWPLLAVAAAAMIYSLAIRWADVPLGGPPDLTETARQTTFWAKWAYPAIHLFAVMAGIILASSPTRKSVYGGFLPALGWVIGFMVVDVGAQIMGRHEILPPVVAGWLGPVLGAVTLAVMWRRARL